MTIRQIAERVFQSKMERGVLFGNAAGKWRRGEETRFLCVKFTLSLLVVR